MQTHQSDIAKSLYILYETLPDEVQQEFLQELQKKQPEKVINNEDSKQNGNRTEEQQKRAIEMYDAYRDDLRKRQLSNTENYDKTILTLSSSGLALSLTALKFAIPLATAEYLYLLKSSWWLFGATIFISIIAYWVGNNALNKQLEIAEEYYAKGIEDAFSKRNWYSNINDWLNRAAGFTFLIATFLIISFVTSNIYYRESEMNDKTDKPKNIVFDSATVPTMQRIKEPLAALSANIPKMQMAPSKQATPPQETRQTTQGTAADKKK